MRTPVPMRTVVLVGVLAVVCPATARAGTITLLNDFSGPAVQYTFIDEGAAKTFTPLFLGSILMTADGADLGALDGRTFEAYCVDIRGPILEGEFPGINEPYQATTGLMSTWQAEDGLNTEAAGRAAAWLYTEIAADFDDNTLSVERTAMQMALWNVLYDDDDSVLAGEGNFYVSNDLGTGVTALANEYLDELFAAGDISASDAPWIQLNDIGVDPSTGIRKSAQDFIGPNPETTPVPEPSAGLLLGMGAMSLAAFRSRKTLFRRS
jgi:hypothetical protein